MRTGRDVNEVILAIGVERIRTGEVVEVNKGLATDPSPINADNYGAGWMVKIKLAPGATLDHLMDKATYDQQLASEGH